METTHGDVSSAARASSARRLAGSGKSRGELDRLADLAARLLGAASGQVAVVSDVSGHGEATGLVTATVGSSGTTADSLCGVVVARGEPLVVDDAAGDDRVAGLSPVASGTVGAYLGVPLSASDGSTIGALCVFESAPRAWSDRDVALLERLAPPVVAELELAALSAEYEADRVVWQLAVDAAGIGAFDWDLVTGELRWDDRLLELFGLDRESFGGDIDAFNAAVHPEDLPRVTQALTHAVETCSDYSAEYRVVPPGGRIRWVAARGRALAGAEGRAVRLLGAAYDTTAVQEGEAKVARVLETMPTAFFQLDPDWRFAYVNAEGERLLGLGRADLVGEVIWDLYPASLGSEFEVNYRRAAATGEPVSFDAYYPAPLDAWYEVRAWPTPDGLSVYFVDVTARHLTQQRVEQSAQRSALLAQVTAELTDTLDADELVGRLAPLVVPSLGDWCLATLVEDDGQAQGPRRLRDVGWWHVEPEMRSHVQRYASSRLSAIRDESYLLAALATDLPIVVPQGAQEAVAGMLEPGEARDLVGVLAPESGAVVRLRGRGRTVGLLTVFRSRERGPFDDEDVATLLEVAARTGLALDNARLFAEQRDLAEQLQRSLLTDPPEADHLEVTVRYEPAAQTAQVGGDWYDAFLQDDGSTSVVIGDVVGHDTAAAAAMGQMRSLLRGIAVHTGDGPAEVLRGVDRVMQTLQVDTTATAVMVRLEQTPGERATGLTRLRWSNAGHPPPMVVGADGRVTVLGDDDADLLLGLDPGTRREEQVVPLTRDSTLLLYTDGLVERRDEPLEAGLLRLERTLAGLSRQDLALDRLCDVLLRRMLPDRREDDVALVAVRLHPEDRPRPRDTGPNEVPPTVEGRD